MYCWSDLNGRLRRHRSASPSTVKNIRIENIEKYKEKDKRHHENNKNKIQEKKTKHYKNEEKYCEKNSKHREGNRETLRQTQRKRYQREKDKIHAKRRERQKQKKEQQLLINQKQFMPIIPFTHSI